MIHPSAVVHSKAQLDPTVHVGPYAVVDEQVVIEAGCRIGPHAYLTGRTHVGRNNQFHAGCVIGDAPQDLKYRGEPTGLRIGDGNVFREHVTVHRSNSLTEDTVIGAKCFFMAHSHVGHNSQVGDRVIMANGALLGGHVTIGDRAFISGNCLVHQFTRVGSLALMQGGAAVSKDLPPFTVARGDNGICGLNTVGLRRAGLTSDQRIELRRLYHLLFRGHKSLRQALKQAQETYASEHALILLNFVASSRRGLCSDVGKRSESKVATGDFEID
jgi:UDP-N-acetylglucosamine acyltransferase